MKRFEYLPLDKESKSQTDIAKRQYQKLDNTFEFDKVIKKEKPTLKKYNRWNLIYDSKYRFYPSYNIEDFNSFSLTSKYPILFSLCSELNKFNNINPRKRQKDKKATAYDNASELYNEYLEIYFTRYMTISDAKKKESWVIIMILKNKKEWTDEEESVDLSNMSPLAGDEEVKEGKGLKMLTPNKLLTTLPILLAHIKAGNNHTN